MTRKIWDCPHCEWMSSSRHWNVKRHLYIKHNGIGEPICNDTNSSRKKLNVKTFNSSRTYYSYPNDLNTIPKSFHKRDNFAEGTLNILRKMVEYKNLLSQLQPTFPPPSLSSGSPNLTYQDRSISDFRDMYFINSISNMFEEPFPPDSWITIALKGRLCQNCFNKIYIPVFFKFEGKNEIFEPQHECDEIGLLYSAEEREGVLNSSNVNLTKQMIQLIKIWMQGKDCVIVAREIGEQSAVVGDINADQNDHWSTRAIRDKLTTLKDDNELKDFLTKTSNSTFGFFKVYSSQQQQQSSARFYHFMILKKEWY
ncbi:MAG TPA: hypothetical protein VKA98_04655 [Nitrososphaeraceae archaeon]|nr:hypothetical protein [Nitrososphaeraceae archaeon]